MNRFVIGIGGTIGILLAALLLFFIMSILMTGCDLRIPINMACFVFGILIIAGMAIGALTIMWQWVLR
jgi:hypothetical protein